MNCKLSILAMACLSTASVSAADLSGTRDCLGAPALAAPTGNVVNVSNVAELENAVNNLADNTTILISPGEYRLTGTMWIGANNVALRGDSTACDDVHIIGRGMDNANFGGVQFGIWIGSSNVKIQNLAISDTYSHPIIIDGSAYAPSIYNVKLVDAGEQFIKSNPVGFGQGADDGVVEYTIMEYTDGPPKSDHGGGGAGYTNGVDVHAGKNWIIRNNYFGGFHTPDSVPEYNYWNPAILIWNGAANTVVTGNTFVDVDRAVAFGLVNRGNDHSGGSVSNNMIYYSPGLYSASRTLESDAAIILWDSPNTEVYHNTILTNGNLNKSIEYRFDTAGGEARNNLVDAPIVAREGGQFSQSGNLSSAQSSMFVAPAAGDLHLTNQAAIDLDNVSRLAGLLEDIDGDTRSSNTDAGADEVSADVPASPPRAPVNLKSI